MRKGPQAAKKHYHFWMYGKPGKGKSKAAVQAARLGKTLYIAVEDGLSPYHYEGIPEGNLVVIGPDNFKELNDVFNQLNKHCAACEKYAKTKDPKVLSDIKTLEAWLSGKDALDVTDVRPYAFYVLDTLTEIQGDTMSFIIPTNTSANFVDVRAPQIQEYGKSNMMIGKAVEAFMSLPMHGIFISHEKTDQDEQSEILTVMPNLTGQNPKLIGAKMSIIGYVDLDAKGKDIYQKMYFQPVMKARNKIVKDQTNKLGLEVVERDKFDIIPRVFTGIADPETFGAQKELPQK